MAEKKRLNKFISDSGVCSRREADKYIASGHVTVNGHRAVIGEMINGFDKVMLNGNLVEAKSGNDFIFMAFNKPVGIISTTETGVKDSIIDYIGFHERIFPIGRLDKDSQGLIFLTNNGDIVNKILRAGNRHEKEYLVTVDKQLTDDFIYNMSKGVPILGEMTKKCKVTMESGYTFRITLIQGLNRQIRRMCEYFGYEVTRLERVRIMNINLRNLPLGEWRLLEENEMSEIMHLIADSSSEVRPASKPERTISPDRKPQQNTPKPKDEQKVHSHRAPVSVAKKTDRSAVANPKARELRSNSANSNGKKAGTSKHRKPSAGKANYGKRK